MHRIDGAGAAPGNLFTEGNPTAGTPATVVTDDWLNAIQEEIIGVLTAASIAPNKANNGQLAAAISALISAATIGGAVAASGVSITDAGNYYTGANVEAALQELGAALVATVAASKVRHGIVTLSTTSEQTAVGHVGAVVEISVATPGTYTIRPDGALNLDIGSAIHVCQAGAGQITIAAGAGVTLLKSASFNAKTLNQHSIAVLVKTAANTWRLTGQLEGA